MYNLSVLNESRRENPVHINDEGKNSVYDFSKDKQYLKEVKKILKRKNGQPYFYEDLVKIIFNENRTSSKEVIEKIRPYTGVSYIAIKSEVLSEEYIKELLKYEIIKNNRVSYTLNDVKLYITQLNFDLNLINNAKSKYLRFLLYLFKKEIEEGKKELFSDDFIITVEDAYITFVSVLYNINKKHTINHKYFIDFYLFNKECENKIIEYIPERKFKPEKIIIILLPILLILSIFLNLFY